MRPFALKTSTLSAVALLSLVILLAFPEMRTVSAMGPNTYVGLYWPLANNYDFDIDLKVTDAPRANTGLFWAHQFQFVGNSGGYIGLQIVGSEMRAIFSIWGAITGNPNTGQMNGCRELEEYGKVWSCGAKYDWKIGVNYRLRLWLTNEDSSGNEWWVGAVNDYSTNSEAVIGTILAPASFGLLSTWSTTWIEYFAYQTCGAPYTRAIFSYPYARNAGEDHAPQKAVANYGTSGCPDANIEYLGDGAYVIEAGNGAKRVTPDQTLLWTQEPTLVREPATSSTPSSGPSISVRPTTIQQGQSITVTGSGFTPNGPVTLIVKPATSSPTADSSGNLYTTFYVGTDFPTGQTAVWAHDVKAGVDSNSVTITVIAASTTSEGYLSVSFDKAAYQQGDTVHISGDATTSSCTWTYSPNIGLLVAVDIYGPDGSLLSSTKTNPNAAGYKSYAYDYSLPANAPTGTYKVQVSASAPCGSGTISGQGTFSVNSGPVPVYLMMIVVAVAVIVGATALLAIRRRRHAPRLEKKAVVLPHASNKLCISCKAELPIDAKFCDNCGSRQT